MSAQMTARVLRGVVGALAVAALVVPAAAAKGPPVDPGEGEETGNNLAVPALFVGTTTTNDFGLTCDGSWFLEPQGEPTTGFPVAGYYYVQGENGWQATCDYAGSAADVAAAWGDNLGGDARLKVGSPIRVEIGLFAADTTGTGWDVVKLEPEVLDRLSDYGILATSDGSGGWTVDQMETPEKRVWAQGATLTIQNTGTGEYVTDNGPAGEAAGAEINATGRIVYGYNLRVPETGTYLITYAFPGVTITSNDIGKIGDDGHSVLLDIVVGPGGGNGGGKGQGVGGGNGGGQGHKG